MVNRTRSKILETVSLVRCTCLCKVVSVDEEAGPVVLLCVYVCLRQPVHIFCLTVCQGH